MEGRRKLNIDKKEAQRSKVKVTSLLWVAAHFRGRGLIVVATLQAASLAQNTLLMISHCLIHLLTTLTLNHTFTVSFQAQNSPFPQIFST